MTAMRRLALALAVLGTVLGACSKDKDVEPPMTLVGFTQTLDVRRAWDLSVGDKDRRLRLALSPAIDDGRVYAAGHGGAVFAVDAKTGKVLWRSATKLPLSAGPGVGNGLVVAGASDGSVVALDAATGARRWSVRASGEVLAAPAVSDQSVIVRTVDGRVRAFAVSDGHEQWSAEQTVPRLSLRGTAPPVIAGDSVVCGFDDGRAVAYGLATGDRLWESAVSTSRGKTEIERLNDIDGAVRVSGRDVFVVGFQGKLAMLALDSGQVWWSRDLSSYRGLALGEEAIYVATADGHVQALRRRDGTSLWTNEQLLRRGLTAPAIDGDSIVVADFEGYLHWIDRATGALAARVQTKKGPVTNGPVAADGYVYLQTDGGRVFAYTTRANGREAVAAPTGASAPAGQKAAAPASKPAERVPGNLPSDLSPVGR